MVPNPGAEPAGHGSSQMLMVVVGVRLLPLTMNYIFLCVPPLGNVLPAKVNDSMIVKNSIIPGSRNMSVFLS